MLRRLKTAYYWLKCRLWRPFNQIKISTLSPDYHDIDYRMLHACFQLLVDYVEREKPFDHIDWNWTEESKFAGKEIKELYDWWKNEYPTYDQQLIDLFHGIESPEVREFFADLDKKTNKYPEYMAALSKYNVMQNVFDEKAQTNLMRLIAIRENLWT